MKNIIFHKGDFYMKDGDVVDWQNGPIKMNDGNTELYWHEYCTVCNQIKSTEGTYLPAEFEAERKEIMKALLFYKYQLEKVQLFDTKIPYWRRGEFKSINL